MYIQKTKTAYPVNIEEARDHLNILITEQTEKDAYIGNLIKVATEEVEQNLLYDVALTSNVLELDDFSDSYVEVLEGNLREFLSVQVSDTSIGYDRIELPRLRIPHSFKLFLKNVVTADPLKLEFTTGWDAESCPKPIVQAILIRIADLYDNEKSSYGFNNLINNNAVARLLNPYKIIL
jgi:hypothetical protein